MKAGHLDMRNDLPPFVVADKSGRNVREVMNYALDSAWGEDENEISVTMDWREAPEIGGYVYLDGTECGGTIDSITTDTDTDMVTAKGRSWHGILDGMRLVPDKGKSHITVSGSVSSVLTSLISRMGLQNVFSARQNADQVSYTFERFIGAYAGITAMLKANGMKLKIIHERGKAVMVASPVETFGNSIDSDLVGFELERIGRRTNHLVCGGTGEYENRRIIHFYADSSGKVSKTQSLFGVDEIAAFYDYSNADADKLEAEGKKKLEGLQGEGTVKVSVPDGSAFSVGDIVTGRDNKTGQTVTVEITKVIAKAEYGVLEYTYEAGTPSVGTSGSTISGTAESSGGGHSYYAGEGLTLNNYTFSADVTDADLNAVSATATNAATQASNASAAAGAAQQAAEKAQETADGKADRSHTHVKADITDFPASLPASDVSAWAKAATKPTYTASEVGAAAASHKHTKADITDFPASMPASDVPAWAKAATKPTYTANEVGAATKSHTHAPTDLTAVVPVSKGGTGATTAKAARYNLFNGVTDAESKPNDGTVMLFAYQSPTSAGDAVYRNTAGRFWDYIKSKASAVFAAINHTHSYAGSSTAGGAANSAKKWDTARKITLTGAVNGSATVDGSKDVTITVTGDQAAAGFLAAHPVGSVMETVAGYDPNESGGTWVQLPSVGLIAWKRTE